MLAAFRAHALTIGLLVIALLSGQVRADEDTRAPFVDVRWTPHAHVEVLLGETGPLPAGAAPARLGTWVRLVRIGDLDVVDILAHCERRHPAQPRERFVEDLIQVLREMGHPAGETLRLVVIAADGETVTLPGVPTTHDKRQAARRAWERMQAVDRRDEADRVIARAAAAEDLQALRRILHTQYAYVTLPGFDVDAAIDEMIAGLPEELTIRDLALGIGGLLSRFGDGHLRVAGLRTKWTPDGHLPFELHAVDGRPVAIKPADRSLPDPGRPFVIAIDGVPIERWLAAVEPMVVRGSPSLEHTSRLRWGTSVTWVRKRLGLPQRGDVAVTLASAGGDASAITVALVQREPYRDDRSGPTRRAVEGVTLLRIPSMLLEEEDIRVIEDALRAAADHQALVIDLRGNGGGEREATFAILPFLIAPDAESMVVTLARARIEPSADPHLSGGWLGTGRRLLPRDHPSRTDAERAAIDRFMTTFAPEWTPPEPPASHFSGWHYTTVAPSRGGDGDRPSLAGKPIAVLLDEECFSATDILLGALDVLPNVVLVGRPSAGGSARVREHQLGNSAIVVRCASMASYLPTGKLYERNGTHPDILVPLTLEELTGTRDVALERALEAIAHR